MSPHGFGGRKGPVNARAGGAHAPKLLNMPPKTFMCTGDELWSFLSQIKNGRILVGCLTDPEEIGSGSPTSRIVLKNTMPAMAWV